MSRCPAVLLTQAFGQHAPAALSTMERFTLTYAAGIDKVRLATGHGSQTADWSGDEDDGMNETICPCDFQHVSLHLCSCFSYRCILLGILPVISLSDRLVAAGT